jgi:uncharacterized protein YoxC
MLRIALILALLAAVGSLALSFLVTKPTVEELRTNLATTQSTLDTTQKDLQTTKTDLTKTKKDLDEKAKDLDTTKTALETAAAEATNAKRNADRLSGDLAKTTKEKNDAQTELAKWDSLGLKPEQVAQMRVDLKKTSDEKEALAGEKTIFLRSIAVLKSKLLKYEEPDAKVKLPDGLKGNVLEVGPQQDFVLLDIGANQGVLELGEMLVRRGDKLVGKVRIVKVDANRSIANLLPAWRQGDVAVAKGDAVLY